MGMPVLGPPTSSPFSPLAPTLLQPEPPPAYEPGVSLRPAGSAYGLEEMRRQSQMPYEPPAWERAIHVVDPTFVQPGATSPSSAQQPFQRPGFPERINVNPFGDDPLGSFLGGDAGVALGITPGQGERGGAYHGIATTPLTLANMSTWGRERLLALLTSAAGLDYQQPENAQFGQQPEMNDDTVLGGVVKGLADFGNLVWGVMDAPLKWYRDSNAFNRGKQVRELFLKGSTGAQALGTEMITTAIFGGQERYTMDALQRVALTEGVDIISAIAKRYDFTENQVAMIAANPNLTDEELGRLTDGSPLSVDPVSNLLLEGGMQVALLAAGGAGVARGAAMLGRTGVGALEALGTGLRGGSAAAGLAGKAGYLTRKALQINAWNTTAGWTIGGAEWGIKQLAVMAGNDELVAAMDRLMWQMPLSMNPGWNLIDGFSSHPIDAYRNLRRGQVAVGRRGTPGYVGQLDLKSLSLRDGSTGEVMSVAGRKMTLRPGMEEFKVLGRLRDLTPDDMHAQFFQRLGWDRARMEQTFGEGNPYDLTWDDARNALFHVALQAVREGKGAVGRMEGLHLPTMADRTAAFVRDNAAGALKTLDDNLKGVSSSMVDLFKADFWNLAARNDTGMGVAKAHLGPWDKDMAFMDFVSWIRASKTVRAAIEAGTAAKDAVPGYRRTVNRAYISEFVNQLAQRFGPDDVVPLSLINQLKRFGGAVELRGKGSQLIRGRQVSYTRRQLEDILDSVIAEDEIVMRRGNTVPRDQAAAYRRGIDPGQDPMEDQRVAGITPTEYGAIEAARQKGPEGVVALPPERLLRKVAEALNLTVDSIRAKGPAEAWNTVFQWYDDVLAQATDTAAMRDSLDRMAQAVRARVADGRMDQADAAAMIAGLARIRDEVLAPLDKKLATSRPGLYRSWEDTAQEGLVLAQDIERHLTAEPRLWRVVEVAPGVNAALPQAISGQVLTAYQALIAKVLKDGSPFLSEADRVRLEDPRIHPFLKHDILATAVSPTDRPALLAVEQAVGGDPRDLLTRMMNDGGIDPTDPAAGAALLAQQADAHVREGHELGARAAQLGRRFQTLGGAYSDELADLMDRVADHDQAIRAVKPEKGKPKPKNIGSLPMDPEDGARRSVTQVNAERARAQKEVANAQAAVDRAEAAVRGAQDTPTAFDPDTMEWAHRRVMRERGGWKVNRDAAHTLAAQLRRDEGAITQVRWDKGRSAYVVEVAQPKPAAPEAPAPRTPPATISRWEDATGYDNAMKVMTSARTSEQMFDGWMDLNMYGSRDIADPAFATDVELDPLRQANERWFAQLSKDLEDNPPADPANDPRVTAMGKVEEIRGHFARRDRAAQSAAPAPMPVEVPPDFRVPPGGEALGMLAGPYDHPAYHDGGASVFSGMDYGSYSGELSKVHVAATPANAQQTLVIVDRVAREMGVEYKWVKAVNELFDGEAFGKGGVQQGKFITAYPDPKVARAFTERIDAELRAANITGGNVAPSERRFAPDSPITHRWVPDPTQGGDRYAMDGDYAGHTDYIGTRASAQPALENMDAEPAESVVLTGRTGTVQDPRVENARPIEYELRVVEADSLLNSWDEGYPGEYQQRERRQGLIDKIARAPDERMLLTETAGEGTPFVLPDGRTVFAGNHRTQGMRDATPDAYAGLKAALVSRAAEFGVDPTDVALMRRPVLVRVLPEGVASPELSLAMNRAAGDLKAENIARTLNDALQPDDWALFNPGAGDLASVINLDSNKPFLNRIKALLSESERGKLTNEAGEVTLEGLSIIKAAVIGKVLGDAAAPIVVRLATLTDPGMAIYANGFARALPDLLSVAALMGQGRRPMVDLGAPLREALQLLTDPPTRDRLGTNLKARLVKEWQTAGFDEAEIKQKVAELEASVKSLSRSQAEDWFNGIGTDPTAGSLAFAMWSMKSAKEVGDFLEGIAAAIKALPDPMEPSLDLFGGPPPVPAFVDLANAGIRRLNEARLEAAGPMRMGVEDVPLVRGGDGITRIVDTSGADTGHRIHPVVEDPTPVIEANLPTAGDLTVIDNDWRLHTEAIQRSTGRVTLRVSSDAEATALRAYLAGDDAARLPAAYRVVDGQIEALPEARVARARDLLLDAPNPGYKDARARAKVDAYLRWMENGESGPAPEVSAEMRKRIDGALYDGRDPALPALRDALAGRDFEVRGPSDVAPPASVDAPTVLQAQRRVEVVDRKAVPARRPSETVASPEMNAELARVEERIRWLEEEARAIESVGDRRELPKALAARQEANELRVVRDELRKATGGGRQRPTEIVAGTKRDIDPDYEATTGLSPETPDADLSAQEAAAGGVHRVVTSSDAVHRRSAQRASGAPVVDDPRSIIEINAPDAAERLRLAQQARDTAAATLEAARAKLDALGPAEDLPPAAQVLTGSELDLYHRYIDSSASPAANAPLRQPRNVDEVIDLLTSLDLGVPPLRGSMAPEEMERLRMALMRVLDARLNDLGVEPSAGPARRGGAAARRGLSQGTGTRVDEAPTFTAPEDLSAELSDVVRRLQGRVYEAADPLDGWEGTQYEIALLPTKGRDGGPIAPRIPNEDWLRYLDDRFPTLGEELLHGRKRAWGPREEDARWKQWLDHTPPAAFLRGLRTLSHMAFDPRPERVIVKQSIDRFTESALRHFVGSAEDYERAIGLVHGMIGLVHEGMKEAEFLGFPLYRRVGLYSPSKFEAWATKAFEGATPQWYHALKAEMGKRGVKHPLAELWRESDNRIRNWFKSRPGGIASFVDTMYGSGMGRKASSMGRGVTVFYHTARFLIDLRWLGLELVEAPTLTMFQEGPGAVIEGMGRGANAGKLPMMMGRDALEDLRTNWAWWIAQSDPGANIRTREKYILAIVRRRQEAEFPRALREAMSQSPDLKAAVRAFDNGDEMAWLKRLDADWELGAKRGRELTDAEAKRLFTPWFERGIISQKELDELLKAKRYTGHPEIDRELSRIAEPWMQPLLGRLAFLNEQGWNDAARLIFGQTDRSNVQRLMNHPLLYWPVSYQLKATRWLAGLLFDRAFGVDTGSLGAVTLGMIHQKHKDRMASDPEYAANVASNPTLMFFAQMLFPIAPWDMGVGLSPFTRLAINAATADSPEEGYRRNIFSVGPGYTYYSLLPRLFYEQSKPGSWAQTSGGLIGDIFEAGQRIAPYSVPVAPQSTSELYNAEQQVAQGGTYLPQPPLGSPFLPGG